jgi:copper chaperone
MYQFNVPDMTCGHCASTITKALKAEDSNARIEVDLAKHLVRVESRLSQDEVAERIAEAGYTPSAAG